MAKRPTTTTATTASISQGDGVSECLRLLAEGLVRAAGSNPDTASDHLPCPLVLGYVSVVPRIRRTPVSTGLRALKIALRRKRTTVYPFGRKFCVNSTNIA